MYLASTEFGSDRSDGTQACEIVEEVEWYLSLLIRNGQIGQNYVLGWSNRRLIAQCYLARPTSIRKQYHSQRALQVLEHLVSYFEQSPRWSLLEDNVPKRFPSWKNSSSLVLWTHANAVHGSVSCGETGRSIPHYLLPLDGIVKEDIGHWTRSYQVIDQLWLESGALEIPAYRELVDPNSELSSEGRELCQKIERATNKPTYYFLHRYWGRRVNEEQRKCPGCGKCWRVKVSPQPLEPFHKFYFRCEGCRVVGHQGLFFDDERHARIGEYRKEK